MKKRKLLLDNVVVNERPKNTQKFSDVSFDFVIVILSIFVNLSNLNGEWWMFGDNFEFFDD